MKHLLVQRIHCLLIDLKKDFEHCEKVVEFLLDTNRSLNIEHFVLAKKLYQAYASRLDIIDDITCAQTLCYTHNELHQGNEEIRKLYNEVAEVCDRVMELIESKEENGR